MLTVSEWHASESGPHTLFMFLHTYGKLVDNEAKKEKILLLLTKNIQNILNMKQQSLTFDQSTIRTDTP